MAGMKIKQVFLIKQSKLIKEENHKLKVFIDYLTEIHLSLEELFLKAISHKNE